MNQRLKLRLFVLGTAAATTAALAGGYVALESPTPQATAYDPPVITENETVVTTIEPMQIAEPSTAPAPAAVPAPAPATAPAPVAESQPSITVVEQRLTEDERIQAQVMDVLARNDTLSGKIGVETRDQVVNLSGYVTTNGMVMRAGRDAGSVVGVRYVVNEIRPKVGPVTY